MVCYREGTNHRSALKKKRAEGAEKIGERPKKKILIEIKKG